MLGRDPGQAAGKLQHHSAETETGGLFNTKVGGASLKLGHRMTQEKILEPVDTKLIKSREAKPPERPPE